MSKKKKSAVRQKVLSDHQKIGSKLVPLWPLLFPSEDVRWSGHIIPELLWLGLLNEQHGWQRGAALSLELARSSAQVTGVDPGEFQKKFGQAPKQWFATTSSYLTLSDQQRRDLVASLKPTSLNQIRKGLLPLVTLYPDCPLRFLLEGGVSKAAGVDLETFKRVVAAHYDKEGVTAVRTLTNAVYIAFCTNKLRVIVSDDGKAPTDPKLRNFPAVEQYPNTEESKIVASEVRGTVFTLFESNHSEWSDYFWNRGLEIEPCDYEGALGNED